MKHAFPKRRLSTLTRPNIYRFVALWDGSEPPSSGDIARRGSSATNTRSEKRHIRRVEKLRPTVAEEPANAE